MRIQRKYEMSIMQHPSWQIFTKTFDQIARHRHRYEVFRDFVTISALSLNIPFSKVESRREEHQKIRETYSDVEFAQMDTLFTHLVELLEIEPSDVLGTLYMSLELGDKKMGQFFTPQSVCEMLAEINFGATLPPHIPDFITVGEPTCGAGGMIMAVVKIMQQRRHDPGLKLWTHCQDIDRLAALMCYVQLSMWHIPGVVVVGNSLSNEVQEVFYTPRHYLGLWGYRLQMREQREANQQKATSDSSTT